MGSLGVLMGFIETAFLKLKKPTFGATPTESQTPWGAEMNANLDALDQAIQNLSDGAIHRKSVTLTLSSATGTVNLGKVFEITGEEASAPGRFRLYRTSAGRDSDLVRPTIQPAPNTAGLLLDDVFAAGALVISEIPALGVPGSDGLCAWSWDGALGSTITLQITVFVEA